MDNNTKAYDVPYPALFYIIWAGIPVEEYIMGSEEQRIAHMEYIASLYEDENDGF